MFKIVQELEFDGRLHLFNAEYKFGNTYCYIIDFRICFKSGYFIRFDSGHTEREIIDMIDYAVMSNYINKKYVDAVLLKLKEVC